MTRVVAALVVLMLASIVLRAQSPPPPAPVAAPPAPAQPVPFSHKRHAAIGFDCRQCHANPDGGRLMTFPPTVICMSCHQAVAADRPAIQKLAALAASGAPLPWARVYALPDYVFWSHAAHLRQEIACERCHGRVAERDALAVETDILTMLGCQTCHDQRKVLTDCGDCHEPRR